MNPVIMLKKENEGSHSGPVGYPLITLNDEGTAIDFFGIYQKSFRK
jgi:hypothetical protein